MRWNCPAALKDDHEIAEAAAERVGAKMASAALQGDREIVLEAVKQDGTALYFASAALKDDREIVLEAVKQNGHALQVVREMVLQAVSTTGVRWNTPRPR